VNVEYFLEGDGEIGESSLIFFHAWCFSSLFAEAIFLIQQGQQGLVVEVGKVVVVPFYKPALMLPPTQQHVSPE
jgi:hypothetical protein